MLMSVLLQSGSSGYTWTYYRFLLKAAIFYMRSQQQNLQEIETEYEFC